MPSCLRVLRRAQTETFIRAALSLRRHFIHLTEERVNTVCNSPFKGHQPAFVEPSKEPLFPSLRNSEGRLFQSMGSGKKKKKRSGGKVNCFQVPCSVAMLDAVSCGKTWRSFCSVVVLRNAFCSPFAFGTPSSTCLVRLRLITSFIKLLSYACNLLILTYFWHFDWYHTCRFGLRLIAFFLCFLTRCWMPLMKWATCCSWSTPDVSSLVPRLDGCPKKTCFRIEPHPLTSPRPTLLSLPYFIFSCLIFLWASLSTSTGPYHLTSHSNGLAIKSQ